MDMMTTYLAIALPETLLSITTLIYIIVGAYLGNKVSQYFYGTTVLIFIGLSVYIFTQLRGDEVFAFSHLYIANDFTSILKIGILLSSAASLLLFSDYFKRFDNNRFEIPILIMLSIMGMFILVSANNLMALYLGLELQSLALYVLASVQRDTLKSTEAGVKYFVLGALASGMFLYGCSLIYGFTGTTDFTVLASFLLDNQSSFGITLGLVFVLSALAFKVSAVPFHMWTPDVYEGAPTPITTFFATTVKLTSIAVILRVLYDPFQIYFIQWQQILIFLAIVTMVFASIAAISQDKIKRLLAYSSIGHVGYMLIAISLGTSDGLVSLLIYLVLYVIMNIGVFSCLHLLQIQGQYIEKIEDFKGLAKTHPAIALPLVVLMFSMAGIPPLAGFFGKFYVFMSAVAVEQYTLAIIGVLASVIAAFYYLRIIKMMIFDAPDSEVELLLDKAPLIMLFATATFNVLFILYPSLFSSLMRQAVAALL